MSDSKIDRAVSEVVQRLIDQKREIGVQVVAYLGEDKVLDCAMGLSNADTGEKVTPETLFNMFSVTKAIAATALHMQVDRGHIGYDSLVADFWPEYACKGKEKTRVSDVLSHRAGAPLMPEDVTPELMCDREWMISRIAGMDALAPPGEKALYHSMTFGWLVDKLVQQSDPLRRTVAQFVKEEIARPIGAPDIWIGLPDSEAHRVAKLVNADPIIDPSFLPPYFLPSMPPQVALVPEVFERPDVRRAAIAGVGGIFTAHSCARFWAMLANGGEIGGVRLLSRELVESFNTPRTRADEPDLVMFGKALPISGYGFWLGHEDPPTAPAGPARVICHPGAGNSIGFADIRTGLAVAICHNRMFNAPTRSVDSTLEIADAIRSALGIQ